MTNLEIRNFAYDTIAEYLFENHSDFGRLLYDAIRQGGTIEDAVESFLKEEYANIGNMRSSLGEIAMKWDGLTDERLKIFSCACNIVAEHCGVEHLFNVEELVEITGVRDNYRLGFITPEEMVNLVSDYIRKKVRKPSIYLIDSVLKFVGLPRFWDCIDSKTFYFSK